MTTHDTMMVSYGKVRGNENTVWSRDLQRMRWEYNPFRNLLIRRYLRDVAAVLCVSDALRLFLERYGFHKLQTLHNGIDTTFWREVSPKTDARRALNLPTDAPLFLLAGRIGTDKGSEALLHAMPPDAHVLLAGRADLSGFALLGKRLHYFAHQTPEEMRLLYSAADATVVPSIYLDPFPTVCLESMACTRPVIATCMGGAKEVVEDGKTGWVVDPRSSAFAERLQWCSDHREELTSFGKAGRERVEKEFSLEKNLDALLALYKRVIGNVSV